MALPPVSSKLTPETHERIVSLVRAGNFRETAAAAAGIESKTLRRWLRLGAEGHEPYATLTADVNAAEAMAEARDVALISKAATDDWKAASWRLERKAPSRWGQRVRVEVEHELNAFLDRLQHGLPPEVYERVLALASGDAGEPTPAALADEPDEGLQACSPPAR